VKLPGQGKQRLGHSKPVSGLLYYLLTPRRDSFYQMTTYTHLSNLNWS